MITLKGDHQVTVDVELASFEEGVATLRYVFSSEGGVVRTGEKRVGVGDVLSLSWRLDVNGQPLASLDRRIERTAGGCFEDEFPGTLDRVIADLAALLLKAKARKQ